ncbi:MAG: FtsX-like permease family protein, partial [Thermoanaerobaculia bacterium]
SDPRFLVPLIREQVHRMEPQLPLFDVATLPERLSAAVRAEFQFTLIFGALAALAVTLTLTGLYGLLAQMVAERAREIAIRIAIGAAPLRVVGWIAGRGLVLGILGIALGLAAAVPAMRLLESQLYGVDARDFTTYLLVAGGLAAVTWLASYLPALGAAQVDPISLLKLE